MKRRIRLTAMMIITALAIEFVPGSVFAYEDTGIAVSETNTYTQKDNKDEEVHAVSE